MDQFKSVNHTAMEVIVLGTGCAKCKTLETLVRKVVADNNIDATVTKEEDLMKIMEYGVMATPALVVNGEVKVKGRLPKEKDIIKFLEA